MLNIQSIGRILIASLFVISGFLSAHRFGNFFGAVKSKNLPFPLLVAIAALLMKILGGLSIMFNIYPKYGTIALIVFTTMATILFHNPFSDSSQINQMLKNSAIIGGLSLLL